MLNNCPIHLVIELIILITDYGTIVACEIRILTKGVSREMGRGKRVEGRGKRVEGRGRG